MLPPEMSLVPNLCQGFRLELMAACRAQHSPVLTEEPESQPGDVTARRHAGKDSRPEKVHSRNHASPGGRRQSRQGPGHHRSF